MTTRQKILEATVRLFLNNGFHQTTTREICAEAGVSLSSFNNAYRSKEGVLLELVGFMFQGQFSKARRISGTAASPVTVYAVETAIQLAMTGKGATGRAGGRRRRVKLSCWRRTGSCAHSWSRSVRMWKFSGRALVFFAKRRRL